MSSFFSNLETDYDREYSDFQLLKRYGFYLSQHKKHLTLIIISILSATGFTLLIPFALQQGIDNIIAGENELARTSALIFLGLYILIWLSDYFRNYQNTKFTAYSTQSIRNDLFKHVQHHDLAFFDDNTSGSLQSRIMDDTQELSEFVKLSGEFLVNLLIAVGIAFVLFYIDARLTLLALTVIPFLALAALVFRKIARKMSRDWRITISNLNQSFAENVAGIRISRSFAREQQSRREFDKLNRANYSVNVKKQMFFSSIFPVVFVAANIGLFFVLYFGGIQSVQTGNPSPGTLLMFTVMLQRFYFPVILIATFYQQVQAGMAAAERIFSLMDVEANVKDLGTKEIHSPKGDITIKNLNFSYEERVPIFQDFNLHIKAGERIAIVGHTGAGKSSLISLISRFYEYQGEILIDGVDIKEYTLKSYRSLLGLVVQESFLFSGTIESNIKYGMKDASTEDVVKAAKMANAFEFIENMPKGMNFEVLEGGKKLSQGQKQLISLARVFLIDPKILLFDEATASIDAYSEALIQDAIERILKNRTSIVVAHRLTTIQRVDRIIVLDHGEIIEEGSHDDLMLKRGAYASIYDKYFSFQEIDPSLLDAIED